MPSKPNGSSKEPSDAYKKGRGSELTLQLGPHTIHLPSGVCEGIARCISQMCTYPFETGKTQLQVLGRTTGTLCFRGIMQSSCTTGIVFTSYFSVYHALDGHPLSSSIAAFTTSFLKIPIGNCMRSMQIQNHRQNFLQCGKQIVRTRGIQGLYSGYGVSIAEDMIETTIRNGIYEIFKKQVPHYELNLGMIVGALAGSFAAGITTPFDTIRANMTHNTTRPIKGPLVLETTKQICRRGNPMVELYKGVRTRSMSNGVRYALFYLILGALEKHVFAAKRNCSGQ